MRLLFVADGRSPIALNWMRYFVEAGHEVHLATTFDARPDLPLASLHLAPVAFSSMKATPQAGPASRKSRTGVWSASLVGLRTALRQWLGPFTLGKAARRLGEIVDQVQPELVHAMRIPYEGMLAALQSRGNGSRAAAPPLLVSVWGNDFTLHAPATPWMRYYTRLALQRASALHTDCRRDVRLAYTWGFPTHRPAIVLPGGGGIQLEIFYPGNPVEEDEGERREPGAWVVNPRGVRAYVPSEPFFRAIPAVLARLPATRFACPTMAGNPQALHWLQALGIAGAVELLPQLPRPQMADLFRRAQVVVSPSTHDGTPNTLLEAMACGCFPIAGDLESIREWITPGVNGLLVDPNDTQALAEAILLALERPELRRRTAQTNIELVAQRAEYGKVMGEAEKFYKEMVR